MEWGKRVEAKRYIPLPVEYIERASSVPGNIYEIRMKIKGYDDSKFDKLLSNIVDFLKKFNAKLRYLYVNGDTAIMQINGSPFAWADFILMLPDILTILGIILSSIAVYLIVTKEPGLAGLFVLGVALLLAGFYLEKKRAGVVSKIASKIKEVI